MNSNFVSTADWVYFSILLLVFMASVHQAWENLIKKRISKFAIDGILFFLSSKFAGKETHSRVRKAAIDPQRLLFLGIYALLVLVGSADRMYKWILVKLIN